MTHADKVSLYKLLHPDITEEEYLQQEIEYIKSVIREETSPSVHFVYHIANKEQREKIRSSIHDNNPIVNGLKEYRKNCIKNNPYKEELPYTTSYLKHKKIEKNVTEKMDNIANQLPVEERGVFYENCYKEAMSCITVLVTKLESQSK